MTTRTGRRPAALAAALTLGVALTACGGTDGEADVAAAHNDADTAFAQHMIVHHEGAVEMAELAAEEATTDEVRELARSVAEAQEPEIERMTGWLDAWGEEPSAGGGHAGHGATADEGSGMDGMEMEGMDQQEAMAALRDTSGAEVDRRFLELMTAHHRGAIAMSETELADGENSEALELARTIVEDQTAEIAEMDRLLAGL